MFTFPGMASAQGSVNIQCSVRSSIKEGGMTTSTAGHRLKASDKCDSVMDSGLDSMCVSVNES